ncbi:hypothetical protein PGH07_02725 [Sulfurovum sp. zt1-1]|uniref:Uncharacterized protein n=1 Tax=Sulfurovum zhangzhouensis TaxID=3019067 RepID=A0ABT7QW82_9BACT|nr:hypothetical protein [Sulfurovum zhangzhouensis]MDM5271088.1 hypothetical protein [Sulfurovum zhangzhouensis]
MFDRAFIAIILIIVISIIVYQTASMPIANVLLAILFSIGAIPLYKKCQNRRKKPIKRTFWRNYWYDIKCTLIMIPYGIGVAGFIVWIS